MKAWRYRFELREGDVAKESIFAIGDYAIAPGGETPEEGQARRGGRRFTLAEARDERTKARALVKQGINPVHHRQLARIKREQESATTFEAVANEWLALKDWEGHFYKHPAPTNLIIGPVANLESELVFMN